MNFSERLKSERKRLKLNQTEFAVAGGVTKQSVFAYEKGLRKPDSDFLEKVAALGVDIAYVLTGERGGAILTPEEKELLSLYRSATLPGKAAAIAALTAGGLSTAPPSVSNYRGRQ